MGTDIARGALDVGHAVIATAATRTVSPRHSAGTRTLLIISASFGSCPPSRPGTRARLCPLRVVATFPLLAVVARLVEPVAVLLGGPAVCPAVLLDRVRRQTQLGHRPHRCPVPQRAGDGLLQGLLRLPHAVHSGVNQDGVYLGDRSRIGHAAEARAV